jgi:hypothetical protein
MFRQRVPTLLTPTQGELELLLQPYEIGTLDCL